STFIPPLTAACGRRNLKPLMMRFATAITEIGAVALAVFLMVGSPSGVLAQSSPAGKKTADSTSLTVLFATPGGIYTSNLLVALSSKPTSAKIHYTTDGSEPTERSPSYSEPLKVTDSAVIKARAFHSGRSSPIACETYILAEENLANFSSNLPLVIVTTFGQ